MWRAKLVLRGLLQNSQGCSQGPGCLYLCKNPVTTCLQKKEAVLVKPWGWGIGLHVLRTGSVASFAAHSGATPSTPCLSSKLVSCCLAPTPLLLEPPCHLPPIATVFLSPQAQSVVCAHFRRMVSFQGPGNFSTQLG